MATLARECRDGKLNATVAVVISDVPTAAGLDLARDLGIETRVVRVARRWSRGANSSVGSAQAIDESGADLVILAGFMRILSALPCGALRGADVEHSPVAAAEVPRTPHARAGLGAAEHEHGASVHFVTAELDGGPVVLQSRVPVLPGDSEATLSARVQATEHIIYPRVVNWIAAGRLRWQNGQVQLDGKRLEAPSWRISGVGPALTLGPRLVPPSSPFSR